MDTPTAAKYAVETIGLTRSFGSFQALRSIDLKVTAGSTMAVFGPNGAGKTTLIKILASVMRPSAGKILIQGFELKDNAEELRSHIGLVAHQSYLYGNLSAQENLGFYARMYAITQAEKRVEEMLGQVGLKARRYDRVNTFSRGMLQRLSLARALLHHPSILLLDEPETGLDQQALESMWGIIKADSATRTVIFTSHNFERALSACDEVLVMEKGRIAFTDKSCRLTLETLREAYQSCTGVRK
jgi:heme exporter protein A